MARYHGNVGYAVQSETRPGVWVEVITERPYYGDVIRNNRRLQNGVSVNDNIVVSNEISIVADPYAYANFHTIRYAEFMGVLWKVTNVDVQRPRLVLSLGGEHVG